MATAPLADRLSRREREIVNAVFALGNRASAEDIRGRLTRPPSDSTVRVLLTRLERKGYLRHVQDGPRYMYSARISPSRAKRSALKEYLHTFFGGSIAEMVTGLVRTETWTAEELDKLTQEIEHARKGKT